MDPPVPYYAALETVLLRGQGIFDHVIVGSGQVACLLADRLSADPQSRVLVIEVRLPEDPSHVRAVACGDENAIARVKAFVGGAGSALLALSIRRPGLRVLTNAQVLSVVVRQRRAVGMRVQIEGQTAEVQASSGIMLCCGAIGTPKLLEVSGIGQADRLRGMGIESVLDLPGVGRNLQARHEVHLTYRVQLASSAEGAKTTWASGMRRLADRVFGHATLQEGISALTEAWAASTSLPGSADARYRIRPIFSASTVKVAIEVRRSNADGRGSVHARGGDFQMAADVELHHLVAEEDRRVLADAVRRVREVFASAAFAKFTPVELTPGAHCNSEQEIAQALLAIARSTRQFVGTARMGDDAGAVVDRSLRVRGLQGLRIVDESILPTVTATEPRRLVLRLASRAARMALADQPTLEAA